ncbi:MAG: hypothetical protein ACRD4S_14425 [Candidatus Acidiferrales bacterium]
MADGITPLTPEQIAEQEAKAGREKYLHRALVGFDQFVNVLTDGDPDETISSRAARAAEAGKLWGVELSKLLDVFQADHGVKAQAGDIERAEKVEAEEALEIGAT